MSPPGRPKGEFRSAQHEGAQASHDDPKRARWVRCPACAKQALYSTENPARPFCSARCRSVDLGAWASESYRVAVDPPPDADEPPPGPDAPH